MANITSFDDLSESEDQDVSCSIDVFDETSQDVCKKNLLEDFAADAKLTRQSVSHGREHMQVHLRIRPFTATEKEQGESQDCMETKEPSTLLMRAPKDSFTFKSSQRGFSNMTHKFTFSRIFGEDTSQKDFFDETMLLTVKDFIDGQNCLVFTYGVTNAGKTYTIQGVPQDGGILPRSLDVIFNSIEGKHYTSMQLKPRYFCDVTKLTDRQLQKEEEIRDSVLSMAANTLKQENSVTDENDDSRASNYTTATEDSRTDFSFHNLYNDSVPNVLEDIRCRIPDDTSIDVEAQGPVRFSIWVSFAEIYNEYIYDLLEAIPKGKKVRRQPLKLSEDKNGQIYIKGLKEIYCRSADEAYKILKIGQKNLSIAATKLNQCSSRSHCIFSVKILRVVDVDDPHVARVSKLSFCDLAGSERYTRTQNTGERLKEAGNINTSLLTLGKCIHTLRYNQNHPKTHPKIIPFRESKLTRLFQTFFMGKGKASMIVNVNQCASGFDETIHVLKFSAIAKQVTTITSKLDNKWKIPAAPPKYPSSRDLSLAINQALPRNRVSVAWATPGYNPDANLDLTTVEETFIEEDEDEDETDEEDEEEDVETTPKDSRSKLVSLVESLKSQLIESKKLQMMMEVQIRAEVCQEMSQQLVQIESEYKDRMEEERMINEEMYEKRLEMYEKSVKKPRKRPHTETDLDDELVSSLLLHAEQVKVQEQAKTITSLRGDVQKLKDTLDETEEKMNVQDQTSSELQGLIETSSQTLEEAKAKMCAKDQKLLDMETKLKEAHDALAQKEKEANELAANTSEIVSALESKIENLQNNLEVQLARVDDLQKELANSNKEKQEKKEEKKDNLQSALAQKEKEAKELAANTSEIISTLESKIEDLQNDLEVEQARFDDLQKELANSNKKRQEEKEEKKDNLQSALAQKEKEAKELAANTSEIFSTLESKIENLQNNLEVQLARVDDLQKELANSNKERQEEKEEKKNNLQSGMELEESLNKAKEEAEKYKTELDELKKKHESELQSFRDELKASSKTLVRVGLQIEKEKQKSFDAEEKIVDLEEQLSSLNEETNQSSRDSQEEKEKILTQEKSIKEHQDKLSKQEKSTENCKATIQILESQLVKKEELERSIKDLEEDLDDLQTRFDQTNTKGQEAVVRAAALENDLEYLKEAIKMEQKAHNDTKMVASDYGCQVSLLRSQLETAERTTASSNGLAKRNQELQGSLNEMQRTLTEKEIALAEASKWQGNATDLRSQLKTLDDKLKQTEATVQNLSQQCTGLQQSLPQKENETVEIQQLKDLQKTIEEHCQGLAKSLEDQKVKTKSKADSIKQLMTEIETQCHKLQAAEKDSRANSEVISVLKAVMQEQEATMASQDEILASKELELDSLRKELTDLQDRHSELHTVSSENRQAVRESNKNHEQFKREKETMRREHEETLSKLHEIERENEEHKKKHEDTKAALSDYVKEKRAVEGDCEKLRGQLQDSKTSLAEAQRHPQDCPEKIANQNLMKKITALEQEVMKQVADKDETLKKWREEKDNLVRALQAKMESLLADSKTKETLLEEKNKHIKHLKDKMVENITASQSMTDDDSDSEDTREGRRRSGKRNKGVQREVQQLTELLEKEREDTKTAQTSSKRILAEKVGAISELEEANRTLQTQLGLIEQVSIDIKPLQSSDLDSFPKDASSSPCGQPESPDLFALEVKDQESFSLPGRRRTRVQMDMTPLQKKQPARKGRANTRRTKKRKSMEEMEELNDDTYGKRNRNEDGGSRVTRSSRKTRTQRGEEDFVDENVMDGKLPKAPLTSGRGKRAALSKIGDMLQNSPIAKSASSSLKSSSRSQPSAKKFVETATSHMASPAKSPEVQIVSYHPPPTTEKKRKRRLQTIDISAPFQSSPFEVVNHGETRGDSSHSIVTRKLRSRNTRV